MFVKSWQRICEDIIDNIHIAYHYHEKYDFFWMCQQDEASQPELNVTASSRLGALGGKNTWETGSTCQM